MEDRVSTKTLSNGAVRYGLYNADGSFERNVYLILSDEPSTTGTALNKANLLADDAVVALKMTGSPTPSQALKKIGEKAIPAEVAKTGSITITLADNTEYKLTAVTALTMTVPTTGHAHGFVTFASGTPTVTISGYTKTGGDDPTKAVASEVWEFDVVNGYILWKDWSNV